MPLILEMLTKNYTNDTSITGWQPSLGDSAAQGFEGWIPSIKTRLFQRLPHIKFIGTVHEMVDTTIDKEKTRILRIPVHHYGFAPSSQHIELTRKKIHISPTPKAYFELGIQYKELGLFALAEQAFQNAGEEKSIYPLLNLAIVQQKQEKYDEAIKNYQKVIEKNEKQADAHFGLGFCFFKKNNLNKAIRHMHKATQQE